MRLGDVLRKWRRASDLGVREAAALFGISHGTLSRIERGEKMDGDNILKAVCDALFKRDEVIALKHIEKYWEDGSGPRVVVEVQ